MRFTEAAKKALTQNLIGVNIDTLDGGLGLTSCPYEEQHILRCPVSDPEMYPRMFIPYELIWITSLVTQCAKTLEKNGIRYPYIYITVRSGKATHKTDDMWHVDAFTNRITQLPQINFVWFDNYPTELLELNTTVPSDFNPDIHNIMDFIQKRANLGTIKHLSTYRLHGLLPYHIHRRPMYPTGAKRTFIRITFSSTEIISGKNHSNPRVKILKTTRDGVKDFRDKLISYDNNLVTVNVR